MRDIPVLAFDTGTSLDGRGAFARFLAKFMGYASSHIAKLLAQKGAKKVLGTNTFYVLGKEGPLKEGELERARQWAGQLLAIST